LRAPEHLRRFVESAWRRDKKTIRGYLVRNLRPEEIDDALQEIFRRFVEASLRTTIEDALRFLHGIARYVIRERQRARAADRKTLVFVDKPPEDHDEVDQDSVVVLPMERLEQQNELLVLFEGLKPHLAQALWLVKYEGFTYAEAAARMNVSARQVESYVVTARAVLAVRKRHS
jgi:RNA polymerase sigma factor (sigma-70 family)